MFDPMMTLESGQFHHWERRGDLICAVSGDDALFLKDGALVRGDDERAAIFFDEGYDYDRVADVVKASEDLKDLAPYLPLRILKQDPWEAVVGYIFSSNNNLLRIRKSVLELSRTYGRKLAAYEGLEAYALPKPEVLCALSPDAMRALGAGYRDKYLIETARQVASGEVELARPYELDYAEAKSYLMKLSGVGPKVADCILLFGYGKKDAFPVDVWIARAMERFGDFPSRQAASDYALARFGEDAGYVQQLLFMNERRKK